MPNLTAILSSVLITICCAAFNLKLKDCSTSTRSQLDSQPELSYLPKVNEVKKLAFGYNNVASQIFWFKTVNYFGKHFATDKNFQHLDQLCQIVTTLNPKADQAYQFCSNMLSWEVNQPKRAIELLNRAVENNPQDWLYLYLRGFTNLYFLKDTAAAKNDFSAAAILPNAPVTVKRLAAKQLAASDQPEEAIKLLEMLIKVETDSHAIRVLEQRLLEIQRAQVK